MLCGSLSYSGGAATPDQPGRADREKHLTTHPGSLGRSSAHMTQISKVLLLVACEFVGTVFLAPCSPAGLLRVGRSPDVQQPIRPPERVRLRTQDGGLIYGDLYGVGDRGVVLAHGGRFNKESWEKQAQELAKAGFRILAIDFRGYGDSRGPGQGDIFTAPLHLDVLAAVHYLRDRGAKSVSAIGGSLGGGAAANAAIAEPGQIDRLVLLGATPDGPPEKLTVRKLYIMTRDDTSGDGPRLPGLRAHFDKAPEPKELIILEGAAHAQFIFGTEQGERVMREILRFLSAP
jgi:dienelactone hydrolase